MAEAFIRPFRPVELTASTLTSFPLQAMAQQLMTEDAFQTSGRNALTLIHHRVSGSSRAKTYGKDLRYLLRTVGFGFGLSLPPPFC